MSKRKGMTINKFRRSGYSFLKFLGDVQAVTSNRPGAVRKRVGMRVGGKLTGWLLREIRKNIK